MKCPAQAILNHEVVWCDQRRWHSCSHQFYVPWHPGPYVRWSGPDDGTTGKSKIYEVGGKPFNPYLDGKTRHVQKPA